MVERSPEKAGVGGSIPSLATIVVPIIVAFAANAYQLSLDFCSRLEWVPATSVFRDGVEAIADPTPEPL